MLPPAIDTSVARTMYSATSSKSAGGSSRRDRQSPQTGRVRSLSTASTSSSISLVTPLPSSGNTSSSSLDVPKTADPRVDSGSIASASEQGNLYSDEDDELPVETIVRALHDFVPQQQNATCLAFRAGELIRVLNRDPSGWWDGEIDGRRGWFPSNYVGSIDEEEPPPPPPLRKLHVRSVSDTSFVSRASTVSPLPRLGHDSGSADILFPGTASHTHPLMVPLLHSVQLLQNTALVRRVSHYQPAVACIIQCIRALLQQTECLARGAPLLKRFPIIAQERKRVLAELALLVTQSKKASSPELRSDEDRDPEEEIMLRLAGQVFARVRRFLAVLVQCGVDLPERNFTPPVDTSTSETACEGGASEQSKDLDIIGEQAGVYADGEDYQPKPPSKDGVRHITRTSVDSSSTSRSTKGSIRRIVGTIRNGYHGRQMSLSSASSFSSFSSLDSPGTPPTPPFPEGPCTSMQVQQALRSTHDSLLSTIAAFIGHVHAHSRTAHASSTGHLFALVRQIVDVVCRLLTIVDAVMCVEGIPWMKRSTLEGAKENLYQTACALADTVREQATCPPYPLSEEEEMDDRQRLLKAATEVLRAGSDCASAVKQCLSRPLNAPPYIVVLPSLSDVSVPPTPDVQSSERRSYEISTAQDRYIEKDGAWADDGDIKRSSVASGGTVLPETLEELHEQVQVGYATTTSDFEFDNEEPTIQPLRRSSSDKWTSQLAYAIDEDEYPSANPVVPEQDRQAFIASLPKDFSEPIEEVSEDDDDEDRGSAEKDLPSPTSQVYTDAPADPDTTAGAARGPGSLEDKVLHGELPSIPQTEDEEGSIPLAWTLSHDYAPQDVAYNSEGQLVGATLEALVEKMTAHDQIPDAGFQAVFFLTFRLFTSPTSLAEAVIARFNLPRPSGLTDADATSWSQQKLLPVRLRVQNLLKSWLEVYWRVGTDDEAIPILQKFARETMSEVYAGPAQRLDDLIMTRSSLSATQTSPISERQRLNERIRDVAMPLNPTLASASSSTSTEVPRPVMTKALLASLRSKTFDSIAVTDFDALELARQMTLIESGLYCAITAEELIELGRPGAPPAVNVKAVTTFSTAITGWVSECILDEQDVKRRALLMKFFIKVADRCTSLNNYSTPRSILAALDSSTISRLHQTWSGLAQKSKIQLEALRKLADHARNYHEYRTRLRNTTPPAVPFLGLYLTDLTFCREGNPSHRASPLEPNKKLLNFNKYHKLARIVQDMQCFQVAYNLKDVAEAQQYLHFCLDKAKDHGDLDDLYRRSQLLEPKRAAEAPAANELKPSIFGWGNRSQASSSQATVA